jgi:hypothetical protein
VIARVTDIIKFDSSSEIQVTALDRLATVDADNELIDKTIRKWARSTDRSKILNAINAIFPDAPDGGRQSLVDERIRLLSDPQWGMNVEISEYNDGERFKFARQYAIKKLGRCIPYTREALPILTAEKDPLTVKLAAEAVDAIAGFSADLPIKELQGEWELVHSKTPDANNQFLPVANEIDADSLVKYSISGTTLQHGDGIVGRISHVRGANSIRVLVDPEGKMLHCTGSYELKEKTLKILVREIWPQSDSEPREETYEFRRQ